MTRKDSNNVLLGLVFCRPENCQKTLIRTPEAGYGKNVVRQNCLRIDRSNTLNDLGTEAVKH